MCNNFAANVCVSRKGMIVKVFKCRYLGKLNILQFMAFKIFVDNGAELVTNEIPFGFFKVEINRF